MGPSARHLQHPRVGAADLGPAFRQRVRWRAANLRVRRRPDAPYGGQRPDATPWLLCLLLLSPKGLASRRGAALRHPWIARIHAWKAGGSFGGLLAGPAYRLDPAYLPVQCGQSVRRDDRQAAWLRNAGFVPEPADAAGGPIQGPAAAEGCDRC